MKHVVRSKEAAVDILYVLRGLSLLLHAITFLARYQPNTDGHERVSCAVSKVKVKIH